MPKDKEEELNESIQQLIKVNQKIIKQHTYWFTFLRGLVSAIGQTLGIAIVLSLVAYLLKLMGVFEYIAPYLNQS